MQGKGMIDLCNKMCEHKKCTTRPTYGFKGKEVYHSHIIDGMKYFGNNKICTTKGCNVTAFCEIEKMEKCFSHKTDNMINQMAKLCCTHGCFNVAYWGFILCY